MESVTPIRITSHHRDRTRYPLSGSFAVSLYTGDLPFGGYAQRRGSIGALSDAPFASASLYYDFEERAIPEWKSPTLVTLPLTDRQRDLGCIAPTGRHQASHIIHCRARLYLLPRLQAETGGVVRAHTGTAARTVASALLTVTTAAMAAPGTVVDGREVEHGDVCLVIGAGLFTAGVSALPILDPSALIHVKAADALYRYNAGTSMHEAWTPSPAPPTFPVPRPPITDHLAIAEAILVHLPGALSVEDADDERLQLAGTATDTMGAFEWSHPTERGAPVLAGSPGYTLHGAPMAFDRYMPGLVDAAAPVGLVLHNGDRVLGTRILVKTPMATGLAEYKLVANVEADITGALVDYACPPLFTGARKEALLCTHRPLICTPDTLPGVLLVASVEAVAMGTYPAFETAGMALWAVSVFGVPAGGAGLHMVNLSHAMYVGCDPGRASTRFTQAARRKRQAVEPGPGPRGLSFARLLLPVLANYHPIGPHAEWSPTSGRFVEIIVASEDGFGEEGLIRSEPAILPRVDHTLLPRTAEPLACVPIQRDSPPSGALYAICDVRSATCHSSTPLPPQGSNGILRVEVREELGRPLHTEPCGALARAAFASPAAAMSQIHLEMAMLH